MLEAGIEASASLIVRQILINRCSTHQPTTTLGSPPEVQLIAIPRCLRGLCVCGVCVYQSNQVWETSIWEKHKKVKQHKLLHTTTHVLKVSPHYFVSPSLSVLGYKAHL